MNVLVEFAASTRRAAAFAILLAFAASGTQAASFDCTKASTRTEKLICADAELSRLDSELGQVYAQARRSAPDAAAVQDAQRTWLKQRDKCQDAGCLARIYRERIAALGANVDKASSGTGGGAAAMGEPRTERSAKAVHITQEGPSVKIDASYPRLGSGAAAAAGERVLAAVVDEEIASFRKAYLELLQQGGHQGPPWELGIDYDDVYTAPRFWAVGLASYSYTGGAHGGVQHLPVVIDRRSGQRVPPAGLFRNGSAWLERLAAYSYQQLSGHEPFSADDDWLRQGTAPTADNYRKLLPLADGLHVVFEQYQVGPYVIGSHEVTVPYAQLSGLLNPDIFPQGHP